MLGIVSAVFVDVPLARWVHQHQTSFVLDVAGALGTIGQGHWTLLYCLLVVGFAWKRHRWIAYRHAALFVAVSVSGITANIIKVLVCRPRPPLMLETGEVLPRLLEFSTTFLWNSFPSGHSTTALSIAIVGSYALPRMRWATWTLGLLLAGARIALNVHYLSDVIAGSLIGLIVGWWCVQRSAALEAGLVQDS